MRNSQKYRELLLPKIQTVLTERKQLQASKEKHTQKEASDDYWNLRLELPSARLKQSTPSYNKVDYFVALTKRIVKGCASKNKENVIVTRKESLQLCVPGRFYQLKKEMDCNEIFIKRNQVSDWSRKSAVCNGPDNSQKIRRTPPYKIITSNKTEDVKPIKKQELSGWQQSEDNNIEIIMMNNA